MKFKKLVESSGSENKMTIRVTSGLNADGCDIVVTDSEGNILHKGEYRYGYNASHSKKWAEWYPEKPFMRDIIDGLCSKYDIDKSAITFKSGSNVFNGTDVSDASVVEFKNKFVESFEMAAGGDDFDGEIAAMRAEQKELEARRAARKERFALMHKLFDKHMNADPNAKWIDKIYELFEDAEKVMFIGNKYGTLPGKTEDGQPIKYRYSIEEYNIYTDPYREFVYITTNKNDLSESLKEVHASWKYYPYALYSYTPGDAETGIEGDKFDIIDVVKSADEDEAKRYFKSKRMWYPNTYVDRISEDDYNAFLKEREEWSMYESAVTRYNKFADEEVNEALEEERKTQYVICGVTNEGTRMLYDAVNDNFTTDYASATKYDDMDVARDDWFKIPRSGFRRIFIPVYDPAVFESVKEEFDADKVQKRIACTTEFDNGHVFHNDYFRASSAEAEERAKQASIENPNKVFYVKYDDVMNPSSDIKWKNGEQLNESDEPIYFDPDDESEVDFRYYVYANNDDVVSDAFDFEEDAISWAQENNYPIVKIHNYYRDTDGELNPDGDPEIVWKA